MWLLLLSYIFICRVHIRLLLLLLLFHYHATRGNDDHGRRLHSSFRWHKYLMVCSYNGGGGAPHNQNNNDYNYPQKLITEPFRRGGGIRCLKVPHYSTVTDTCHTIKVTHQPRWTVVESFCQDNEERRIIYTLHCMRRVSALKNNVITCACLSGINPFGID